MASHFEAGLMKRLGDCSVQTFEWCVSPNDRGRKGVTWNVRTTKDHVIITIFNAGDCPAAQGMSTWRAFVYLVLIFIGSIFLLFTVYSLFPKLEQEEKVHVKLPRSVEDAKKLGLVLSRYKDRFFFQVLAAVFVIYVFLQTFAIPGSIFLSVMSGYLFPFHTAILLVCTCSALGASFCYLLSYLVGRKIAQKYFPEKIKIFAREVEKHRAHLLNYILFLRITPFLPNWLINIASPILNVPISVFFWGTFFGVAAPSCLAIQAGTTLQKLTSTAEIMPWTAVVLLCVFGVLFIVPVMMKSKLKEKML